MSSISRHTTPPFDAWHSHMPASLPPNHALNPWLLDRGSLTARIVARSQSVRVQLLAQKLAVPHRDERRLAGLRDGEKAWVREILLIADGQPVVYARSILPRQFLRGAWSLFANMGTRPLGAALFADPQIERGPIGLRRLDSRDARYHRALHSAGVIDDKQPPAVWARRSRFERGHHGLIVCEVFLPAILNLKHPPR